MQLNPLMAAVWMLSLRGRSLAADRAQSLREIQCMDSSFPISGLLKNNWVGAQQAPWRRLLLCVHY